MNETPRTHSKKTLFFSAVAATSLAGLGWVWAAPDATAPEKPATPPAQCDKGGKDHKGPKDGPWGRGDRHRGGPGGWEHRGGPGHGPGELFRDLKLTAEQKEKVKAIFEAQKPKIEEIRKEERAKMKAVFDETESQIRPLLTPEQVQVLDDAKKLEASKAALKDSKPAKGEKTE